MALKCFKSFSGFFIYLFIFIWSLNLRGLARNQLLPSHLSHSGFSTSLPLADGFESKRCFLLPGGHVCGLLKKHFVSGSWDQLILLKNYELSQGNFLCHPEGQLGKSFSFLTALGWYSSTKWHRRTFKVNTVMLISFSDPVTTFFPLRVSIPLSFYHFFLLVSLDPFFSSETLRKLRKTIMQEKRNCISRAVFQREII